MRQAEQAGSAGAERTGPAAVRVDKWLWAVRICPTRTAATELCSAGRVRVGGEQVKASRLVTVGDELTISGRWRVTACRVERLIEKRVGAPVAATCYTDLTPAPSTDTDDLDWWDTLPAPAAREAGAGRPTKRDRRRIDRLRGG
jgi:ribosome-associated heat shock protein Hsp15